MGKAECKNVLSGGSDNVDRASHEPRKIVPTKRLQRSTAHDVVLLIARFYPSILHVRLLGSKFQFLRLTHFCHKNNAQDGSWISCRGRQLTLPDEVDTLR